MSFRTLHFDDSNSLNSSDTMIEQALSLLNLPATEIDAIRNGQITDALRNRVRECVAAGNETNDNAEEAIKIFRHHLRPTLFSMLAESLDPMFIENLKAPARKATNMGTTTLQ